MPPSDLPSNEPFFIVGTGRSGTTLLQAMLTSHPRLAIPPETKFFQKHDPGQLHTDEQFERWIQHYFNSQDWRDLGLERSEVESAMRNSDRSAGALFSTLLDACRKQTGKPRIGEKSPLHCQHVQRIVEAIPRAQFVHIYRDPRDVVASMRTMQWTHGSIRDTARLWRKILDEHLRLTRTLPADRYTGLRYESLIEDPEGQLRRLCDFLHETFDPAMLDFHKRADSGFHERERDWKGMTNQPITTQSIGRYRDQLSPRQVALIERLCMPLMRDLGYEPVCPVSPLAWRLLDGCEHVMNRARRSVAKRLGRHETTHQS